MDHIYVRYPTTNSKFSLHKTFVLLFQIRQSYDPRSKLTPSVTFSSTCRSNDEAILGGCSERWKSQIEQTSDWNVGIECQIKSCQLQWDVVQNNYVVWQKKTHLAKILELKTSHKYKEGIENFWKSVHFSEKIREERTIELLHCEQKKLNMKTLLMLWPFLSWLVTCSYE